jgi:ATP-binding cassette subfamily F protein 3
MIRFEKLSLRRGTRLLFSDASFTIHPGYRVGITGANGTGKSSLFALLRGDLQADAGACALPDDWVLAHVAQETPSDPRPAIEYVLDGDEELRAIEAAISQAEQTGDGEALAEAHGRYETADGYTARARAARLIHGLGFLPGQEGHPVETFSGGWRMRLNLARALMCRSDLLLLDEPTNHLDLDAVIWLEEWLRGYPGTLLLISHDRDFLDAVVGHVAHIEQGKVAMVTGNYSAFEQYRAEQLAQQQAAHKKQQREIAHIQSFVTRFKAKATKAKQAQSRIKALERMELIAPAHVDSPFHFSFRVPDKLPHPLLRLEEIAVGYAGKAIISDISLDLTPGARIGLLGPNGAGKSTLIKLLAGELEAIRGKSEAAADLNLGYFAQHQLDQLHGESTALEHMTRLDPKAREQELRDYLGGFGFAGERFDQRCKSFSGGEKARLVLALLVYRRPNLLLLDEPTNHLDLEMRHALALALQEYQGAMVVVSHDRHLLRTTTDTLLLVHDGRVEEFRDDLDRYGRWLAEQRSRQIEASKGDGGDTENSAAARKEKKRQDAERRKQLQPLRKRVAALEKEMAQLNSAAERLDEQLGDTALYEEASKERLKEVLKEKGEVERRLAEVEEQWLEASEELEELS